MSPPRLLTRIQRHLPKTANFKISDPEIKSGAQTPPAMSSSSSNKPYLSILCFGDSLTAGYSQWGMKFTPYSDTLTSILSSSPIGEKYNIEAVTDGVSGQKVTDGFVRRMDGVLEKRKGSGKGFDWVVFLGGTNDLGWGKPVNTIWEGIESCTEAALKTGAKVLVLTVPECRVKNPRLDGARMELNSMIKEDEREWVFVLDLFKEIKYHDMEEEERERIWDDGLHFAEEGYERIGRLVAQKLLEIMEGETKVENSSAIENRPE